MPRTRLILTGGFLGAGKTTLLDRAAKILADRGSRVGMITNDQAANLVDTSLLSRPGRTVKEIAGGCFCCRFGELIEAARAIVSEASADTILGEPVGSCTDLAAAVLQPIKDLHGGEFRLAPLSVVADPDRLREILSDDGQSALHPSARYILRKQIEEADIVLVNKSDLLSREDAADLVRRLGEWLPGKPVRLISALTGEGVEAWLGAVLADEGGVGRSIVDVDYDVYAEGEAVLGWLNVSAHLYLPAPADWRVTALRLLADVRQGSGKRGAEIAHAKLTIDAGSDRIVANLTSTASLASVRGSIRTPEQEGEIVVNVRAEMAPDELAEIVHEALSSIAGDMGMLTITALASLSPVRPVPTHRYTAVV